MKKFFYTGLIGLALFEIFNVYLIMPLPGSQRMNSVDLAYFLYTWRWLFRAAFALLVVVAAPAAFRGRHAWIPVASILIVAAFVYLFNFRMTADRMFLEPRTLAFAARGDHALSDSTLVIAVSQGAEAKAWPIRYIQYHHQVRDTIAGKPVMVTYCNVCRTGRVFEPVVAGRTENFRLVGMDHFNAMFEDATTKSWWRQATGEAITGPLKGQWLPEVESKQFTLGKFFSLYPFGKVMEGEKASRSLYDTLGAFEKGHSKSHLTRTDTASWRDKSWVVGVVAGEHAKAYDWNELRRQRVIHDEIARTPIVIALASDNESFVALERKSDEAFILRNDSLVSDLRKVDFAGRDADGNSAVILQSYQEFWHSWQQFHPATGVYGAGNR